MNKALLLVLFLTADFASGAQDKTPFPDALFGVKLGGVYRFGANEPDIGTFPVKEITGVQESFGRGIHVYFKPAKENKAFKYVENRKKPDAKYFETSFRLYVLPVFPKDALKRKEVPSELVTWEVMVVEWSSEPRKQKEETYYLAKDFCRSFEVDLGRNPEILDYYERRHYSCTFKEELRELSIWTLGDHFYLTLRYSQPVVEKKDKAVDAILRKRGMNGIRPY